jgi:hypothetical protein
VVSDDVLDNDELLYVKKNLDAQFMGKEMKWEWNVHFV